MLRIELTSWCMCQHRPVKCLLLRLQPTVPDFWSKVVRTRTGKSLRKNRATRNLIPWSFEAKRCHNQKEKLTTRMSINFGSPMIGNIMFARTNKDTSTSDKQILTFLRQHVDQTIAGSSMSAVTWNVSLAFPKSIPSRLEFSPSILALQFGSKPIRGHAPLWCGPNECSPAPRDLFRWISLCVYSYCHYCH